MRASVMMLVALLVSSAYGATMSGNLIQGGDFETTAYFKQTATPDGGGVDGTAPIQNHRFSQGYDVGRWLTHWGQPSLAGPPYSNPAPNPPYEAAGGGFSTYDNPRDPALDLAGNGDGYNSMMQENIGNMNRSLDPLRSGNHILDNTMFYPTFGTCVAAPANQVRGPLEFSFDFFYDDWDDADTANNHVVEVRLYGLNFLPTNDTAIFGTSPGTLFWPLGPDPVNSPVGDGQLITRFRWGGYYTDPGNQGGGIDDTGGWQVVDVSTPDVLWDQTTGVIRVTSVDHPYGWDYYVLSVSAVAYTEGHEYFWLYDVGRVTDTFTQGFDNFNVKVLTALLGDVNIDGNVNALDISSFVGRLTTGVYQPEADINQDAAVNALDISGFISCLTGGACGAGQAGGSVVPEPATLGMMLVAAGALRRRR
jgi:hypothetical protein